MSNITGTIHTNDGYEIAMSESKLTNSRKAEKAAKRFRKRGFSAILDDDSQKFYMPETIKWIELTIRL